MHRRQPFKEVQPLLSLKGGGCWLNLIDEYEK